MSSERQRFSASPPEEEIETYDCDTREVGVSPEAGQVGYRLEDLSGLHAYNARLSLMVRREFFRGWDENFYRHRDFWALYISRRGRGVQRFNHEAFDTARGDVFLVAPGALHSTYGSANLVLDVIYFRSDLFSAQELEVLRALPGAARLLSEEAAVPLGDGDGPFLHLSPERHIGVERTIALMRSDLRREQAASDWCARARFWCVLVQMAQWRSGAKRKLPKLEREIRWIWPKCWSFAAAISTSHFRSSNWARSRFSRATTSCAFSPAKSECRLRFTSAVCVWNTARSCCARPTTPSPTSRA